MTRHRPRTTHRARKGWGQPVVFVGILLVALQTALRAPVLLANWFYTDDYALLRRALEAGPTVEYLLEPFNSHLMPGTRMLVWFVAETGPLNWTLAATISLALQLVTSLAALWMLVSVFGARWGILAPLAIYLSTAITAQASLWWISSLNQTPVQLGFFLAVGAGVRYLRTRRWLWALTSGLGLVIGLLFFQKTLLVMPVLAFLALAYFARGGVGQRLVTSVRRYWRGVAALALVSGGYLAYYLSYVEQPFSERPGDSPMELVSNMVGTAFLTGAFGGPWGWETRDGGAWADPPEWAPALCLVLGTLVIVYGALTRRASLRAWVLLGGYLAVSVLLVAQSRTLVFGNEIGLAYRLQTDVVCALVLSLGLAFMEIPGAQESSIPREEPLLALAVPPVAVIGAVGAVTVSGAVNWATYADDWLTSNKSEPYLAALGRDIDRLAPVDLVDGVLPPKVMPRIFAPDNKVSSLTPLLSDSAHFPRSTDRLGVVAYDGTVHQALIEVGQRSQPGPLDGCGWRVTHRGRSIPLRGTAMQLDWWLRIGYLADGDYPVTVSAGDVDVQGQIHPGLNNLYVRIEGTFDEVRIRGLPEDESLCVDTIELGLPKAGPRL